MMEPLTEAHVEGQQQVLSDSRCWAQELGAPDLTSAAPTPEQIAQAVQDQAALAAERAAHQETREELAALRDMAQTVVDHSAIACNGECMNILREHLSAPGRKGA